ncbi:Uncharacterised protein [Mycobacteroides abscessus subsp. massiliense]|uniref:hypothetical protein n=1 Tax=Mycobacteroides abscessus TaxID=36809 RepID=UPI0009C497A1|nr:hypothetical protein [Mycobacteroides abscessus]SLC04964.1 Uncharacterised protein [Mycobacteroides abscessus subsp. massiliense]
MSDRLPARVEAAPREASARRVPGPLDCWWRLGPNIRDQRSARARGVLAVDEHGTYLTVVLASCRVDVWPSEYMLAWDEHRSGTESEPVFEQVPRYLDLLIDRPPLMPVPMEWQQITRRGFRGHPGDIMGNWRYDNPWD